jgi:hypothetical protein
MYRADCLQFASTNLALELGINHPVLIGSTAEFGGLDNGHSEQYCTRA